MSKYCSSVKYRIKLKKTAIYVLAIDDEEKVPVQFLEVKYRLERTSQ
jgi:hypothetical protein